MILKLAATMDGRVAASDGPASGLLVQLPEYAHARRAQVDAILVGTGTVEADDPKLTARDDSGQPLPKELQPLRVVMGNRSIPEDAAVMQQPGETFLARSHDVHQVLAQLHSRGVVTVLVEGGPSVAAAFMNAGVVDEINYYCAPAVLGAGFNAMDGSTLEIAERFRICNDLGHERSRFLETISAGY